MREVGGDDLLVRCEQRLPRDDGIEKARKQVAEQLQRLRMTVAIRREKFFGLLLVLGERCGDRQRVCEHHVVTPVM